MTMKASAIRRITILGNAGSGKSTAARDLGARIGAPVVHLDRLYWSPGWIATSTDVFRDRVRAAVAGETWVCEGNYCRQTFDLRLPRSDLVIWLNTPTALCLARAIRRSVLDRPRPELPPGCRERLDAGFLMFLRDIWRFDRDARPVIEAERLAVAPHVPVVRATCREQYRSAI